MADSLSGFKVNCFFEPIIVSIDNKPEVRYKETNREFELGDKLPCKTLYYDYGESFLIFDYEEAKEPLVHVIENCEYSYTIPYDIFPNNYPLVLVIDKNGTPINIKKASDFIEIYRDYTECAKEYIRLLNKYVKEINLAEGEDIPIKTKRKAHNISFIDFYRKWFVQSLLEEVDAGKIGELYHCAVHGNEIECKEIFQRAFQNCDFDHMLKTSNIKTYANWLKLRFPDILEEKLTEIFFS